MAHVLQERLLQWHSTKVARLNQGLHHRGLWFYSKTYLSCSCSHLHKHRDVSEGSAQHQTSERQGLLWPPLHWLPSVKRPEMLVIDSWPPSLCLSQAGAACGCAFLYPPEADRDLHPTPLPPQALFTALLPPAWASPEMHVDVLGFRWPANLGAINTCCDLVPF